MTEASQQIIGLLREVRLGWIADELIESISLGRQKTKSFKEPGSKRRLKGTAIEPLSDQDEMELIVDTLAQYFIAMPAAWKTARAHFRSADTFKTVEVGEEENEEGGSLTNQESAVGGSEFSVELGIAGVGEEAFREFSSQYLHDTLPKLRRVLSALWPGGPSDFARRFPEDMESKE